MLIIITFYDIIISDEIHNIKGGMVMQKFKKITSLFALTVVFLTCFIFLGSVSLASQTEQAVSELNSGTGAYATLQQIMGIMAWAGFAIAIFKMIQIGIMYMSGIASKRSSASASLLPWFIGCVVCALFGTLGPWIIKLFEGNEDIFSNIFVLF